jgi:hypothetical protein
VPAHAPLWHVSLDCVQSVHVPEAPQAVSSVPGWQLPVESQQPLHEAQEAPVEPLPLPPSSPVAAPPLEAPGSLGADVYEPLLLAGLAESSAAASEPAPVVCPPAWNPVSSSLVSPAAHPARAKPQTSGPITRATEEGIPGLGTASP